LPVIMAFPYTDRNLVSQSALRTAATFAAQYQGTAVAVLAASCAVGFESW
jgi:hypothetical protein